MRVCVSREGGLTRAEAAPALLAADAAPATAIAAPVACGCLRVGLYAWLWLWVCVDVDLSLSLFLAQKFSLLFVQKPRLIILLLPNVFNTNLAQQFSFILSSTTIF